MKPNLVYGLLFPAIPTITLLICIIIVIRNHRAEKKTTNNKIWKVLLSFYGSAVICWLAFILHNYAPEILAYIYSMVYAAMLLSAVSFYHLVFIFTKTKTDDQFSPIHYIVSTLIASVLLIWSFYVPFDIQIGLIENKHLSINAYHIYSICYLSIHKVTFVFFLYYLALGLIRIFFYHKAIEQHATTGSWNSLRWLSRILLVSTGLLILPIFDSFDTHNAIFTPASILPIMSIVISVLYIIICNNYITGNYGSIDLDYAQLAPEKIEFKAKGKFSDIHVIESDSMLIDEEDVPKNLDKESFEKYMNCYKPYLNPNLRITDVAAHLRSNRTYISRFINKVYGMNFSRYINRCRMEEYNRLKKDPTSASINAQELAIKAGFSSYRNLTRARSRERIESGWSK